MQAPVERLSVYYTYSRQRIREHSPSTSVVSTFGPDARIHQLPLLSLLQFQVRVFSSKMNLHSGGEKEGASEIITDNRGGIESRSGR